MDFSLVLFKAHATAEVAVAGLPDTGACGFPRVVIPGTDPRALLPREDQGRQHQPRHRDQGHHQGVDVLKLRGFDGQAVDVHEAGVVAFRDVLASYGISATPGSRLD